MKPLNLFAAVAAALITTGALAQDSADQPAIDACIDALMASGNASAPGGTVLTSSFSEAGTEVMLQDGGGTVWRCIAYSDGTVGVLEEASGSQAADAGNAPTVSDSQMRVSFDAGESGATVNRTLGAGEAYQFILGAQAEQFLRVNVVPIGGEMYYTIRNPDASMLLDGTDAGVEYYGQLWQTGDHIIEVVNQTSGDLTFDIYFRID